MLLAELQKSGKISKFLRQHSKTSPSRSPQSILNTNLQASRTVKQQPRQKIWAPIKCDSSTSLSAQWIYSSKVKSFSPAKHTLRKAASLSRSLQHAANDVRLAGSLPYRHTFHGVCCRVPEHLLIPHPPQKAPTEKAKLCTRHYREHIY